MYLKGEQAPHFGPTTSLAHPWYNGMVAYASEVVPHIIGKPAMAHMWYVLVTVGRTMRRRARVARKGKHTAAQTAAQLVKALATG